MRQTGWIVIALGCAFAIAAYGCRYAGYDNWEALAIIAFAVCFTLGLTIVSISAASRLIKGEVILRPINAFKSALIIFGLMIGIRVLFWTFSHSANPDYSEALIHTGAFSIVYGLYTTAYRRMT
ncbi:hypothetical protein [Sphingobium sp. WCS2017Hpa-17]|uniref:hypothetical protein n=1 Tax=Sphingobium sp. WCS2017Hpa-17 TaxID=3073638 RepID=UPI00288BC712|nr:hypothetical protein [Sphingobium sp. WCS2017Hpa-17]